MNEQELEQIEARANAATPGPWTMKPDGEDYYLADLKGQCLCVPDAIFAIHARQDIPALIAEVRRLKADLEHLSTVGESLATSLDSVKANNVQLRLALEFYANPDNYIVVDFLVGSGSEISIDKGEIARDALKGGSQ